MVQAPTATPQTLARVLDAHRHRAGEGHERLVYVNNRALPATSSQPGAHAPLAAASPSLPPGGRTQAPSGRAPRQHLRRDASPGGGRPDGRPLLRRRPLPQFGAGDRVRRVLLPHLRASRQARYSSADVGTDAEVSPAVFSSPTYRSMP
jgi:hypothetical protein